MKKTVAKILIATTLATALALAWHMASMSQAVMESGGMSSSCLTVCLTQGDISVPAVTVAIETAALAVLLFLSFVDSAISVGGARSFADHFKDRHRYLMKTMVMRR